MVVAAVGLGWPAVSEFLAVDQCLDAGGSFNGASGICDLQESHPPTLTPASAYVPSASGSSWRILLGAALGLVGLVMMIEKGPRS
jgi:hypothetical protein